MDEKEYYRQCIETFQQEENKRKKKNSPIHSAYLGLILYGVVTLLYVT